jgi:hypothetical protein
LVLFYFVYLFVSGLRPKGRIAPRAIRLPSALFAAHFLARLRRGEQGFYSGVKPAAIEETIFVGFHFFRRKAALVTLCPLRMDCR